MAGANTKCNIAKAIDDGVANYFGAACVVPYQYGRSADVLAAVLINQAAAAITGDVIDEVITDDPVYCVVQINCAVIVTDGTTCTVANT